MISPPPPPLKGQARAGRVCVNAPSKRARSKSRKTDHCKTEMASVKITRTDYVGEWEKKRWVDLPRVLPFSGVSFSHLNVPFWHTIQGDQRCVCFSHSTHDIWRLRRLREFLHGRRCGLTCVLSYWLFSKGSWRLVHLGALLFFPDLSTLQNIRLLAIFTFFLNISFCLVFFFSYL